MRRRQFLQTTSLASAATFCPASWLGAQELEDTLGAEDSKPPAPSPEGGPELRVLISEADGTPAARSRMTTLHARDLANDPLPQPLSIAEGRARIRIAAEPMQVSARLNVPGFGEVYCYADNEGRGYTQKETIEFVVAAANTRLQRVRAAVRVAQQLGLSPNSEIQRHVAGAARTMASTSKAARIASAYAALADGLHAGEKLALEMARHRIARLRGPRREFLFGCLGSGWQRGPAFEQRFREVFNFATISWYTWKNEEPIAERIDYGRMDQSLQWCVDQQIAAKGFGYVYMANGATPEWFRQWPYSRVLPEYRRIVSQTARRYDGRWHCMEVINEAHDKANLFRLSQQQILELTRETCRAVREGSPTMKRLLNHCCMWAEYAKRPNADGSRRWSPFRYVSDCIKAGVEFEIIGLQLYYPQHDLFEIERMLDRFSFFKRPVHITEMACNSADGLDPQSMHPKSLVPGWHGPWTEAMQADWLEAVYTLCYSKPHIEAVSWWDLADYGGHFWPHGGLLRADFSPKESYRRLLRLQQEWHVGRG